MPSAIESSSHGRDLIFGENFSDRIHIKDIQLLLKRELELEKPIC